MQRFSQISGEFHDPLGLGSELTMVIAILAEFCAPILVILGFQTRLAASLPFIMMFLLVFVLPPIDPIPFRELAYLFCIGFFLLIFTGAGRFSLDGYFESRKVKSAA